MKLELTNENYCATVVEIKNLIQLENMEALEDNQN
jgi:hypothetical protein